MEGSILIGWKTIDSPTAAYRVDDGEVLFRPGYDWVNCSLMGGAGHGPKVGGSHNRPLTFQLTCLMKGVRARNVATVYC